MSVLNDEEIQLGQTVTVDEFWQRYRPEMAEAIRGGDTRARNARRAEGGTCESPAAFSSNGGNALENSVGQA